MQIGDNVINKHDGTVGVIDSTWLDIKLIEHVSVRWQSQPSGIYTCSVGLASDWFIPQRNSNTIAWRVPTAAEYKAMMEPATSDPTLHNCDFLPYVGLTETYYYCTICDKKNEGNGLAQILRI